MTTTHQIKISMAILVVLGICLIAFLISSPFKEIEKKSNEILSQKAVLMTLEAKTDNLEKFKLFAENNKLNLEKVENVFLESDMPVDFIDFLEKIARDCQVSFKVSSLTKQTDKEIWPAFLVQLSSLSSFSNFSRFLDKLGSNNYLIETQSLNVRRLTEVEVKSPQLAGWSVGDVQAEFSFKVYTK